jgi:3-methyl-2-oxobutanoate hydroxymethyltransferase
MVEPLVRIQSAKAAGRKLTSLTAYDYPTARLLDEAGIDILLVGDSLGMVLLGYEDTTLVTMDEMLHHTRAVARGWQASSQQSLILADLPYGSDDTPERTLADARRLIQAGAHAVKLEGGASHVLHVQALVAEGIAVMSHIGMQPQQVQVEGGYRIKGKTDAEAAQLLADARALETAGAFGLLLELVTPTVAATITAQATIPTIGIGSGPDCDGQVLVIHDLIGGFPWFKPKFATQRANIAAEIQRAAKEFITAIHQS